MTLERPDLIRVLLLEFFYTGPAGTTVVERYCSAAGPIEIGGFDYTPDLALACELPDRTSVLDEEDIEVRITNRWGSVRDMASGRAFPPVLANLIEAVINPSVTDEVTLLHLAVGRCALAHENAEGDLGVTTITVRNQKNDLEFPLDNTAVDTCRNDFGSGKTCQFDINAAMEPGRVTAISGITLTILDLPAQLFAWWERGYVKALGIRIAIRAWKDGTTFKLNQLPPKTWIDEITLSGELDVEVYPGCSRKLVSCRERGQEHRFRALGFHIPYHHPNFEHPA